MAIKEYTVNYTESSVGGYVGSVLEIEGAMSQGETLDELVLNLRDAIEAITAANKSESTTLLHNSFSSKMNIPVTA